MRKFLLLLLVAVTMSTVVSAQTLKFGRVNTQAIIQLMPEMDSAQVKLEKQMKVLQEQVDFMRTELEQKMAAFEKEAPNLQQGIIAEKKKKDILDLQAKLEQFSRDASQELETMKGLLFQPIFKKVQDAVDKVSKLNMITFVIDEAQPLFLYMDDAAVKDLTPLIKTELKLKDKKPATPATTAK